MEEYIKFKFSQENFPSVETIEKWVKDEGCFHYPDVVVKVNKDKWEVMVSLCETKISIGFWFRDFIRKTYPDMVYGICTMNDSPSVSLFLLADEYFYVDSVFPIHYDFRLDGKRLLKKKVYSISKSFGFPSNFLRFAFSKKSTNDFVVVLDHTFEYSEY